MQKRKNLRIVLVVLLGLVSLPVRAMDEAELGKTCGGCHNLNGPGAQTTKEVQERKGPELFYAGDKYNASWMEAWLQKPVRIRPAGMYYGKVIHPGTDRDMVDEARLPVHPVLSAAEAKAATQLLLAKHGKANLIIPGDFKGQPVSLQMGEMVFDKFMGCLGCHRIEPAYGGLSGPELYTAGQRLRLDFLTSFIRNPQGWDPKGFMPGRDMNEVNVQKLAGYLKTLAEEKK